MKLVLSLLLILSSSQALAATGGHHDNEIPKVVIFQFINLAILFGGIFFFTKDGIVSFFADRKQAYLENAQKSALAREQAEKEFTDIKNKLNQLDSSRSESLEKAKAHADDLKKQIVDEANAVTKRIRDEAQLTARLEIERAQKDLRTQLLKDSVEAARMVLTKDISSSDQQKLQNDFVQQVGV